MGLNFCAGFGILLSVAAVVLLVFGEIGQINSSTIPRHLRIVSITTTGLGAAINSAAGAAANTTSIYYSGSGYSTKKPGQATNDGLRQTYEWGYWDYCATTGGIGSARSYCTTRSFGFQFQPALALTQDVPATYSQALMEALPSGTFTADSYLGKYTKVACYLVFIGACLAVLAMLIGFGAHRFAFFAGAIVALLAFLCCGVGLTIYTILFSRVMSAVNGARVGTADLGIHVAYGNGLWISWAATLGLLLAILPYMIACCTGRRDAKDEYY